LAKLGLPCCLSLLNQRLCWQLLHAQEGQELHVCLVPSFCQLKQPVITIAIHKLLYETTLLLLRLLLHQHVKSPHVAHVLLPQRLLPTQRCSSRCCCCIVLLLLR
jgi:hypothetical protein